MNEGWISVKDEGAKGDGTTDDTFAIRNAIKKASAIANTGSSTPSHGVVYFPPGEYRVSGEIPVTDGAFFGCRIEGANAASVRVVPLPQMPADAKVFSFRGGSGAFSNVGIKNMTIGYDENIYMRSGTCQGIYIDGQCFGTFENIRLRYLNFGVWLHNQSRGAFTEINCFDQIELAYCNNGVRIEQGGGNNSFHGNDFNNCYFNIGDGQVGFNHVSGYLYNARFRMFMWSNGDNVTYINANGNASDNIGDITYESFKPGKLTGKGRFWFNGYLRGIGSLADQSSAAQPWQKVFACDNYWKSERFADTALQAGPIKSYNNANNGPFGFFQSLSKENVESIVLNTYDGSPENGFYLSRSGYQQTVQQAKPGLFLSGSGDKIQSFSSGPLQFASPHGIAVTSGGQPFFRILSGSFNLDKGGNNYRWESTISFSKSLIGRLIATDVDAQDLCKVVDICYIRNKVKQNIITEVFDSQKDRIEHLQLKVSEGQDSYSFDIGVNSKNKVTIQWVFYGVIV